MPKKESGIMANKILTIDSNETADGIKVVNEEYTDPDDSTIKHRVQVIDKITRDLIGEVQDSPTANTLLARLNNLELKLDKMLDPEEEFLSKLETIAVNTNSATDISNPNTLSFGTMDAGFFGIIPAEDFITGDALCAELGITQGSSQFSNTPWLKFAFKDKIIITPMKPIRYGISWDHIYEAGAVYGDGLTAGESGAEHHNLTSSSGTDLTPTKQDANVDVNGLNYKVRLMRGAADDPTNIFSDSDRGSIGPENEWNALMLPIHERAVSSSWRYPEYAPTSVANWGINFSDGDLITSNDFGNGSYRWMQETRDDDVSQRVHRGSNGVSNLNANDSANTNSNRGFGPAL